MKARPMEFAIAHLRREFPILNDPALHYLDNAATSQMPEDVLAALRKFDAQGRANVHGGLHRLARRALAAYETARVQVARLINAGQPAEVIFTYGATSAINLLANSFGEGLGEGDEIVLSVLEHHSNLLPWQALARRRGVTLRFIPMTPDGRLDLSRLGEVVTDRCRLVAVTHCSNVTGALTDAAPIVAAARAVGAKVMLDGAQRVPHGPLDVQELGVDFYALSGHKMYGPTGVGVLWGRAELLAPLPPFLTGGQMIDTVTLDSATFVDPPRRFEAGTPPIAGAIGLGAAAEWMRRQDWPAINAHEAHLTARILKGLADIPGARVFGPAGAEERRGVISFRLEPLAMADIARIADEHGVALRRGHHCAQPLMRALGVDGTVRASLAPYNDDEDVDELLESLEDARSRLGA